MIHSRFAAVACCVACLAVPAGAALAQSVVACRDRSGTIVTCAPDAAGPSGGGGGGGAAGALGAGAYGVGYAIGSFLRHLMTPPEDDGSAALAAEAAAQAERDRAARLADAERDRHVAAERRQQQFSDGQRELVSLIRPLDGEAPAAQTGALDQLRSIASELREVVAQPLEAASAAAGAGFDRAGAAASPPSGPLMNVVGVPPPPAPPPAVAGGVNPVLQPMSLQQRALLDTGRREQKRLAELVTRRTKGEISAKEEEDERKKGLILLTLLAKQFDDLAAGAGQFPPSGETVIASLGPAGENLPAGIGSCYLIDPAKSGCLEIHGAPDRRLRIYIKEFPGVFCTINAGSTCSLPVAVGVYHAYAQADDGRQSAPAVLDIKPEGLKWKFTFR